ncbi:TPA: ABC transporter permease subunit [Staphylococcus pseudintermedius]|nr:ABC transporter permease subunit [Staphylococcus pseudintermedius]
MNILQLFKFDIVSILKSPLTYLAILLGIAPLLITVIILVTNDNPVNANTMFSVGKWFFSLIGLLFVIKTITRDTAQGTIQLFLNQTQSRIGYFIAKTLSIIFISIFTTAVVVVVTYLIQWSTDGKNLDNDQSWKLLVFYLILFFVYGLLLFLINLIVQKPALVYTLGILLLLLLPVVKPFIPLIPEIGDNIQDSLKYIPFSYLSDKTLGNGVTFTNWQWVINVGSIVVLWLANLALIAKKDI